jgi:uncharacterized membrane protein
MESRVKLFGHPIHPMLIVFPLGLLATAVIFDVLYWATGNGDLATFSYWALPAGLIGGLAAGLFGLIDFLAIPGDTRARRVAIFHGGGNLVVLALFAFSFIARAGSPQYLPNAAPLVLGLLGVGLALVTAWLGGELVFQLRMGVADGAGLDAPSSLEVADGVPGARSERLRRG